MSRRRHPFAPAAFEPILLTELDLEDPSSALDWSMIPMRYRRARALVRVHGSPLGTVELGRGDPIDASVRRQLGRAVDAQLASDRAQKSRLLMTAMPFATIVIATRERPDRLSRTLDSVLALDYPHYEMVVVDNAPRTPATRELVERLRARDERVRYVREPRPGLARAHNRGLEESCGVVVAFTDDDVVVDRRWLLELARGFAWAEDVTCVTGLILPAELETRVQVWLDARMRLNKGYEPRLFDLQRNRPPGALFPYAAGTFGSGANMAFRAEALRALGGFDPATGAGTRSRGGDDLAAFFGVVAAGGTIAYQPAAIVRHYYRRDAAGLRRQVFDYGAGLGAYLTKLVVDDPHRALELGRRTGSGVVHALRAHSHSGSGNNLVGLELAGLLAGPAGYVSERLRRGP